MPLCTFNIHVPKWIMLNNSKIFSRLKASALLLQLWLFCINSHPKGRTPHRDSWSPDAEERRKETCQGLPGRSGQSAAAGTPAQSPRRLWVYMRPQRGPPPHCHRWLHLGWTYRVQSLRGWPDLLTEAKVTLPFLWCLVRLGSYPFSSAEKNQTASYEPLCQAAKSTKPTAQPRTVNTSVDGSSPSQRARQENYS